MNNFALFTVDHSEYQDLRYTREKMQKILSPSYYGPFTTEIAVGAKGFVVLETMKHTW